MVFYQQFDQIRHFQNTSNSSESADLLADSKLLKHIESVLDYLIELAY